MSRIRGVMIVLAAVLALGSCSRDPNVAKKRYLESGNRYFEKGRYKEARIMYRNSRQKDARYGPAYYHLGLADERLGLWSEAVQSFRRAVELLPADQPDHWDAVVKLSEIYLGMLRSKEYLAEVESFCDQMLKRDPNSFEGHRLTGDLDFARAGQALSIAMRDEARRLLDAAVVEYQKADAIKPGHQGVSMQLARALASKADFAGAEQYYRGVIARDKYFLYAYSELYSLFMLQKKTGDGEQILKLAFQNNPRQYTFLSRLALHYFLLNRRDDMLAVLRQIKAHAADYDRAYLDVGDFYLRLGDPDSAIREYREGQAKDSKKKATYQKRVIEVLLRQGKRSEAADLNAEILKVSPSDNDARGLAAAFLLDRGDTVKALTEFQAVATNDPSNPVAHYNLGRAHAARGEYPLARQQFEKAIALRPDYVVARLALAQLQVSTGQYDAALKSAGDVLSIDRTNGNAKLIESAALMGLKKFADSRQVLDAMLKANPNSPEVLFEIGRVNLADNKFTEAEDSFRRSYQLNPANSRGLMGMVETFMAENRADRALAMLQEESAKTPQRGDLMLAVGNTAVRAGKYDMAIEYFQKLLNSIDKDSKQRGDVYLRIGETLRRKGDLTNAVAALQKARAISPDSVVVLSTLAMVLDTAGKWSEAQQVYEATIKIRPDDGVVLNNLAFLIAEHGGDLNDALSKAQRAKQLLPNMFEVSDTLGWIYLKKNLADNAIDILQELVTKVPTQPVYRYHLGMAYYQKGDKPRARKELEESLKHNPTKDDRDKIQALIAKLG